MMLLKILSSLFSLLSPSYMRESKDLRWGTKSAINYVHLLILTDLSLVVRAVGQGLRTASGAIARTSPESIATYLKKIFPIQGKGFSVFCPKT